MEEENVKTVDPVIAKLEALEKRRAERKGDTAKARREQLVIDLEALDALEVEHGESCLRTLEVAGFVKGLPTMVIVKSPGGTAFYKRYQDKARRAGKNAEAIGAAQDELAISCIVYPADPAVKKAMFEAFPGTVPSAAVEVIRFAELRSEDEKKG